MRSEPPFFNDHLTSATVEAVATAEGTLTLYCGAGVTIDRTGHSWASLVLSGFPKRRRSGAADAVTQRNIDALGVLSPEQLASSLVYVLRESAGSKKTLQDALRTRLRGALYGNPSAWQRGGLVGWIFTLAAIRTQSQRQTVILTTNYDDYIEQHYETTRAALEITDFPLPGLRIRRAGVDAPLSSIAPLRLDPDAPGAYVDLIYLHGRLPRKGTNVSWPLILDENSYAASASDVETAIADAFESSELSVILGTSLRDTPLVRALSATRNRGGERIAVLTRNQFSDDNEELEKLNLTLARNRASELGYSPLFPDFNSQVAQLVGEFTLHTALGADAVPYTARLARWWTAWAAEHGDDPEIPSRLREILDIVLPLLGCEPAGAPMSTASETYQLELWIRADPTGPKRSLTRWARSLEAHTAGLRGKCEPLARNSYLAPVRTFTEGRPGRFDISDLERGRESDERYTWRSFLCVPIQKDNCTVGVLSLASNLPLANASMNLSEDATAKAVAILRAEGSNLLAGVAATED